MNIFSRYMKDISAIVKVIILIFKTFLLVIQYSQKMSVYLVFIERKDILQN